MTGYRQSRPYRRTKRDNTRRFRPDWQSPAGDKKQPYHIRPVPRPKRRFGNSEVLRRKVAAVAQKAESGVEIFLLGEFLTD
jgi:hypothetical protein|nr:MAG TPA: hypothetical protein [Caudoviricetes sp.]DAM28202.1 MAG TPA: hypothetical protein [Caudoviricetes sp.]